ncbi:MAG: CPBP family intramembrane glutamic endopeptidase [Candidatus Thermoplasmatota archaeon]
MDFNYKKPTHLLALILIAVTFALFLLLPILSFYGFPSTASSGVEQLQEIPSYVKLIFEIFLLFFQLALAFVLLVLFPMAWYSLVNKKNFHGILEEIKLKKKNLPKSLLWGLISAAGIIGILTLFEILLVQAGIEPKDLGNTQDVAAFFSPLSLFVLLAVQPVAEEFFYRGFLLDKFSSIFDEHIAVVLTAVLFGLAHLTYNKFFPAIFIAGAGLILGYLVVRTKNLYSAIFAHIAFNLTSFAFLYFI